jgi:DNA-binding winged helix-turn-helix (wHTH) protein
VSARFGRFTLDAASRELTDGVERVHLTPKAFELLMLLVSQAPRVIQKEELHDRLWPGTFVSDATLTGLIKELRRALGDHDPSNPFIRTVHRVGYAFSADVENAGAPSEPGVWHWLVLHGRRVALRDRQNVVGRDPKSDVWIDSVSVSRRHATIVIEGSDVRLEDLGSKNGTMIGDEPVSGAARLRDGDRITFGSVGAVYRTSSAGMSTETGSRRSVGPARRG